MFSFVFVDDELNVVVPTISWLLEEFKQEKIDLALIKQATINNKSGVLRALFNARIPIDRSKNLMSLEEETFVAVSSEDPTLLQGIFFAALSLDEPVPYGKEVDIDSASFTNRFPTDYTALDWAEAFDFKECINVLSAESEPSNPEVFEKCHPLLAINYLESTKYDRVELTQKLIENGFTVQKCAESWKQYPARQSAIYLAVQSDNYKQVDVLLRHGIDLEIMSDVFDFQFDHCIFRLFLFHNANICNRNGSVVQQMINIRFSDHQYDRPLANCLLQLLVHTAYHIPRKYMDEITQFCAIHDTTGWFQDFTNSPMSLQESCRKSFRKYTGYRIRSILDSVDLPNDLKSYLMLSNELEVYDRNCALNPLVCSNHGCSLTRRNEDTACVS